jgi:hypothetical protein
MNSNANSPAFGGAYDDVLISDAEEFPPVKLQRRARGLTKREYFAGLAMQGICQGIACDYSRGPCNQAAAERAVSLADALIAELEKTK